MKTNKILATGIATAVILSLGTSSIYAYEGNSQGGGQGMGKNLTQEQKGELQNMSMEERQEYMKANGIERGQGKGGQGSKQSSKKGGDHNPGDMIIDIPASDLSAKEIEILSYGYSEEMLARDIYNYLYELYGEDIFKKIANSEQKHMEAIDVLLDRYELDAPTGYGDLQSTFDMLKAQGKEGLKEALEVGLQIEILDIEDIDDAILNTDNDDLKVVFTNIGGASYNHMKSFANALNSNNFTTDINYSEFLSEDDLNFKGPLKYKLAERLEAKGIELPEQVSSESLKSKGGKSHSDSKGNMKESRGNSEYSQRNSDNINYNKHANDSVLKTKYKNTYEIKYGSIISKMDDTRLNSFISNVDDIIEKVNNGDYSDSIKIKYNAMLEALKEIAVENLDKETLLDGLFE